VKQSFENGSSLTGYRPADLFSALDGESPTSAFFTTFTFSPSVFQQQYINPLLRHGCSKINVLTDALGYSQSLSVAAFVQGIGTDYRLLSVPVQGSFHAKLVFFRCRRFVLVGVGSGNLTASGLITNAEVSMLYRISDPEAIQRLDNLAARLASMAGLTNHSGDVNLPISLTDDARLITSLDDSIFSQCIFPDDVQRVEIFSPFVDGQLLALKYIQDRWPDAKIRLRIDPEFGALSDSLLECNGEIEVLVPKQKVEGDAKNPRPQVHGKLICFVGKQSATVLIGSANLSRPAYLSTENFEAVVERRMKVTEITKLLKTPGVQWRTATKEDRVGGRQFTTIQQIAPLTASIAGHRLQITWAVKLPERATLRLSRSGRCVLTCLVQATEKNDRTQSDKREINDEVIEKLDGPAIAELIFSESESARGWIDNIDRLCITPSMKRQYSLLDAITSDPEECTIKEVADFIEQLQRNLQVGRRFAAMKSPSKSGESKDEHDDSPFLRSSLLVAGGLDSIDGDMMFERLIQRKMNYAINELSFFRSGERKTGRSTNSTSSASDFADAEVYQSEGGRLPPKIATVLSHLFRQLAEAMEKCDSSAQAAYYIRQIPHCIGATQFAIKKWAAELHLSDLLSQNFDKVISASCAPGIRSIFQHSGSLKLIQGDDRNRWNDVALFSEGIATLEAGLLIDFHTELRKTRYPLIRDMYDVLRAFRLPDLDELQKLGAEMWRLSGHGVTDPPDFAVLRERIECVQGEESSVLDCRLALQTLIGEAKAGSRDSATLRTLALRASHGKEDDADGLLRLISDAGQRVQLCEVPIDENACPKCDTIFAVSVHNQLKSPTTVRRCGSCNTLLVRCLDP
jgi:HKD family nuclease